MLHPSKKIISIIFLSGLFLFSLGSGAFAFSDWYSGFVSETAKTFRLDLRGIYSDCKKVSSSGSRDMFIPTRYAIEWTAFKDHAPAYISLEECINGEYKTGLGGRAGRHNENSGEEANFAVSFSTSDGSGNVYIIDTQSSSSTDTVQRILKFSSTGELLLVIGGKKGDNNLSGTSAQLSRPGFINVDPEGNIYIIDTANYKVKKYSSTGAWVLTIGSTRGDSELGGTEYQLYTPGYVGNFLSGSFSIIDYFGFGGLNMMKVKTFDNAGVYIGGFGGLYGDNNLSGTAAQINNGVLQGIDSSGSLIVVDTGNNKIKKYSSTGSWVDTIIGSRDGLDYDMLSTYEYYSTKSRDGSIYLLRDCQGQCIKVYSQTGQLLSQIGSYVFGYTSTNNLSGTAAIFGSYTVLDVIAYSSGIYIKTNDQIKKYSLTGAWLMNIGPSQYSNADNQLSGEDARFPSQNNMTVDTYGNVYIFAVDRWSLGIAKIKKYSATGAWLMDIGGPVGDNDLDAGAAQITDGDLKSIDIDTDGNIYVRTDRLKKYSSTGSWLLTLGDGTTSKNSLSGRSAGLSYASNNFIVDNSGSIYIHNGYYYFKKYSSTGSWLYDVGSPGGGPGDNDLSYNSALISDSRLGGVDNENNLYLSDFGSEKIKVYSSTGVWMMTLGNSSYIGGNDLSGTGAHLAGPKLFYGEPLRNNPSYRYEEPPYNFTDKNGYFYFLGASYCSSVMRKYSSSGAFLLRIGDVNFYGRSNNNSDVTANFQDYGCYQKGMAVDNSGSIWLGNGNQFFKKYSSSGAFILTVGSENQSQGDNNLSGNMALIRGSAIGMAIDDNNSLYINDSGNKKVKKYSSTGDWIMTLGSGGGRENNSGGIEARWYDGYYDPRYVFPLLIEPSGIINMRNHYDTYPQSFDSMKKYSSTGSWLLNIGSFGRSNQLSGTSAVFSVSPDDNGIISDSSGNIWINSTTHFTDRSTYDEIYSPKIKKYTSTGEYLLAIGNGISGDNALSAESAELRDPKIQIVDIDDNIYIGSYRYFYPYIVKKYSSTGVWVHDFIFDISCSYIPPIVTYSGAVFGYDCLAGEFQKYNSDGSLGFSFSGTSTSDFYHLNDKYYILSDNNTIYKYDNSGSLLLTLGQGIYGDNNLSGTAALFSYIDRVIVDRNDAIILSIGSNMIKKYDSSGNYISTLGQGIYGDNNLSGTAALLSLSSSLPNFSVGYKGDIFILTYDGIKKYSSTGAYIFSIGGNVLGDNNLSGTAALFGGDINFYLDSQENIIVSDPTNNKIKLYSGYNGKWITTIGDGLGGNNQENSTGASFSLKKVFLSRSKDYIFLYDDMKGVVKKYIP